MSTGSAGASGRPVCLFAHPSAELFGADRMLLESVIAAADEGFEVKSLQEYAIDRKAAL